jgi:hypothetical protein
MIEPISWGVLDPRVRGDDNLHWSDNARYTLRPKQKRRPELSGVLLR